MMTGNPVPEAKWVLRGRIVTNNTSPLYGNNEHIQYVIHEKGEPNMIYFTGAQGVTKSICMSTHSHQCQSALSPSLLLHSFMHSENIFKAYYIRQSELKICSCLVSNSISKSNFSLKEVLRGGSTWLWWTFLKRMLMTTLVLVSMQVKHFFSNPSMTHKNNPTSADAEILRFIQTQQWIDHNGFSKLCS